MADYNVMEMMITVSARELEDGATVGVGTGAPCAAAMLAQKTASPNLVIMFEAGGISPQLPEMPILWRPAAGDLWIIPFSEGHRLTCTAI
jgi:glutaconate CoA-transferase subunit B